MSENAKEAKPLWVQNWEHEESWLRKRVALMRSLGVLVAWGITLGPEPRIPTKLEKLEKLAEQEGTLRAIRDARVEAARQEVRDRLGIADAPDARVDQFLDPAIFELG